MTVEEQLRAFGAHLDAVQEPITVGDVRPGGGHDVDAVTTSRRRLLLIAAVAILVVGGVASLVALDAFDEGPMQPAVTSPGTVPDPTSLTTPPTSTVDASPIVTSEPTTDPPESTAPHESTEDSETDAADPGSGQPPALPRPVSGQTQQSIVGEITWTLLEGDASTVPEGGFIGVDGWYLGGVHDGRTWRSSDGIEWELIDLGDDGVADRAVYGEFEFRGETWAQTNDGLARWDGETFVSVALPESPFADLDGLRSGRVLGAPVVLGEELVVPSESFLSVPWDELFFDGAWAEWTGDPQSIRIVDMNTMEGPLPVVAVLSAEFVEGEPGRFEFRDVENNELVTTIEVPPGVDPAALLPRIIDREYREILIGDADGFEAVEPPGGWGVPGNAIVPIDGGVLGVARPGFPTLTADGYVEGVDDWELWTSTDARSWTRLALPTPSGSDIDSVDLASDGSTAILTIYSTRTPRSTQDVESWTSIDGRQWQKIDATLSVWVRPAKFGWLAFLDDLDLALSPDGPTWDIAVSPDGRTWQEVRFGVPAGVGGGAVSSVGSTIFVTHSTRGTTRTLWIGRVADR